MIVVATADFELYHEATRALRERGVRFTTVEPGEDLPPEATVAVAAPGEPVETGDRGDVVAVTADPTDVRSAVEEALAASRGDDAGEGQTVIGVDPGPKPGVAVLDDGRAIAAFHVPLADAAEVVESEAADATDPVVRVGDGDRLKGARIVSELDDDLVVELVDETGTTPYLGSGARGMADVLAAVNVARIPGERVDAREVDPTAGELQRIKDASRRRSDGELTVDEGLARRVAAGELTVDEAVAEHRTRTAGGDGTDGE